jgi:alkaline phosphatase D
MLATQNGTVLPYPSKPIRFRTFPDPRLHRSSNFRFLASSCMKPNFPYTPLRGNQIKGFDLLAHYLWPEDHKSSTPTHNAESTDFNSSMSTETVASKPNFSNESVASDGPGSPVSSTAPTEFMLFLGDFIYADVPLYFGDSKDAYRRLYRRNYQSHSFRKVYERLRMYSDIPTSTPTHLGLTFS